MKRPETGQPIKVAIADDHALFRAGVKTALAVKKDVELIAEADNGMQLLNLLKHLEPDVILLDIQMPIMDGIQTLPEIRKDHPHVKVIILSMHNDHSMISKLMEIGANSYLTKNSDSETIYQAIKTCYEQEFFFNELTNKALLTGLRTKRPELGAIHDVNLTEKELTVLKLMCEEKTTKEIADIVDISPRTVEAIRDKLKTKNRRKIDGWSGHVCSKKRHHRAAVMPAHFINYNGTLLHSGQTVLTADNRGFRYGDGLFETMLVRRGGVRLGLYHFDRLFSGMRLLRLESPFTPEILEKEILNLCAVNGGGKFFRVRLVVF